ncbi:MAG: DUF1501 domain-containing protein [Bacteroidetes bacterium]|nr:DUF1501 domain-containing protein [Bacteroidota bacterium]
MKRRTFLKNTLPIVLPALVNGFSLKAWARSSFLPAAARGIGEDRILVLIQLSGGNDGLNTVIPLEYYGAYQSARANIAIPEAKILRLEGVDQTGLHPAMPELQQLFGEGKLAILQGVSYPQPNFSHFRATDIWLTGSDAGQVLPTGWAGRYLNASYPHFPQDYPNASMPDPLAIQIGGLVSPVLQGPVLTMGMAISNPTSFYDMLNDRPAAASNTRAGDQLAYIREMSIKTDQYAGVIKKAAQRVTKQSDLYPAAGKNPLADQLKIVARLIAGGLRTRFYLVSMGGFDTHAKQTDTTDTTTGAHARLLARLSEAIHAFQDDLEQLKVDDRVVAMTFSEFGRRIQSNASGGTDHGAAAPVFVFGSTVQGGMIGSNPVWPEKLTVNENIALQHDFRAIYNSLLEKWFLADSSEAESILLKEYPLLPIIRG